MASSFLKSLKNVSSRIDSFQDRPLRRESMRRHQRQEQMPSALNSAQLEHQRRLLSKERQQSEPEQRDLSVRSSLRLRPSWMSHDQRENQVTETMFSRQHDQKLR